MNYGTLNILSRSTEKNQEKVTCLLGIFLELEYVICKIIVSQLGKCLKFMEFHGVIFYKVQSKYQSTFCPRTDLNFRHLSGCDTIVLR